MNTNKFMEISRKMDSLIVYKNILADELVTAFLALLQQMDDCCSDGREREKAYSHFIRMMVIKSETLGLWGNIFTKYIAKLILEDENVFSIHCENKRKVEGSLKKIVMKDLAILLELMKMEMPEDFANYAPVAKQVRGWEEKFSEVLNEKQLYALLTEHYRIYGCGKIATYKMFRINESCDIIGIENYDDIRFEDLIGYEYQKELIKDNTKAFLQGYKANNTLLVGSRGTGKSSCIKALANEYFEEGLRLVDVSKDQIIKLPALLSQLQARGKHFIIFIDDLSFEDFETQYKYMKSLLEGGAEKKPDNVLFYATSNRRNIVQEKWKDRVALSDDEEVHNTDAMNEKISLADRFGLTITFPKPTYDQYMQIAAALLEKEGVAGNAGHIKELASQWELSQKGISGRSARQFVNNYIWKLQ